MFSNEYTDVTVDTWSADWDVADVDLHSAAVLHGVFRPDQLAPVADAQARLIEPLSERELELLRLLPSHLSYREIGERMYLSTNTVKSYVKSVYRKLDADRRTEAVEHARSIGLVP